MIENEPVVFNTVKVGAVISIIVILVVAVHPPCAVIVALYVPDGTFAAVYCVLDIIPAGVGLQDIVYVGTGVGGKKFKLRLNALFGFVQVACVSEGATVGLG